MSNKYFIDKDYISRLGYTHYDDTDQTDGYQDEIYLIAKSICEHNEYTSVLDIGCGSGFKLNKYFEDYNTTGMEIEPTLSWLKNKYPNNVWIE